MPKTLVIRITGRVQGVSFRWQARQLATSLHLAGSVVNEPDQTVSLVAQGTGADMEAFLDWCRHGPPGAQVTGLNCEYIDEPPLAGFRTG